MLKYLTAAAIAASVLAAPALSTTASAAPGFATKKVVVIKKTVRPHRHAHIRHWHVNPRPGHVHKRVFLKKPAKVIVIKKTVVR
jgi:hypothetical protein